MGASVRIHLQDVSFKPLGAEPIPIGCVTECKMSPGVEGRVSTLQMETGDAKAARAVSDAGYGVLLMTWVADDRRSRLAFAFAGVRGLNPRPFSRSVTVDFEYDFLNQFEAKGD